MLSNGLLSCEKDLAHQLWQVDQVLVALGYSLFDVFVDEPEVTLEVFESDQAVVDQVLLERVLALLGGAKELSELVSLLIFTAGLVLGRFLLLLHSLEVLRNALLAHWLLTDVDNGFWEMLDANVAIHLTLDPIATC